jgi:hypothetical protein
LIRDDHIDVLVDLSGHTAGSRLTVFAHRPAPVQVSWLGYFATTGLRYIDAVLLDESHAPEGFEEQFVEEIVPVIAKHTGGPMGVHGYAAIVVLEALRGKGNGKEGIIEVSFAIAEMGKAVIKSFR